MRRRVGPAFAVGVRLSLEHGGHAKGLDLDDSLQVAAWLAEDGADFIHASLWRAENNTRKYPDKHPLPLLRAVLPKDVPVIACGSMWSVADAEAAMALGADMIALGRAAILNPEWPRQAREPGWEPKRPPITQAELIERDVSPKFAGYLTRWKNLVAG